MDFCANYRLKVAVLVGLAAVRASAFCGFYVAKADTTLFNKASQVIMVREDNRTALTMFSDYRGELSEFALVVPVPEVLTREQINVGDRALVERVDAFSAPRLVEYFDPNPCEPVRVFRNETLQKSMAAPGGAAARGKSRGVKIEAKYTVGEYDILILSAKQSDGLETWLNENGYKLPKGASKALQPYIKQSMKFFVAKVNIKEQAKTGFTYLRPLQFAFESPKFMLPLRLGMVNADGPQDLVVYAITKSGRVETTNYRTVKLPSEMDVPIFVKDKFGDFYKDLFRTAYEKENKKAVFLEYAWNMAWCDPCAAEPLTSEELRKAGVFWLNNDVVPSAQGNLKAKMPIYGKVAPEAFLTRLHVRYDAEHFPEDLSFQITSNSENYQGRYVLRHAYKGEMKCPQAAGYMQDLKDRHVKEAETLASLTGWKIEDIRKQMGEGPDGVMGAPKKWYENIFR